MILHIDLDCYYCSAERVLNPSLRNIPLAVGGGDGSSKIFSKKSHENEDIKDGSLAYHCKHHDFNASLQDKKKSGEAIRGIVLTSSYEARAYGVKTAMSLSEALSRCSNLTIVPPNHPFYRKLSNRLFLLLTRLIPVVEQSSIDEFYCDISGMREQENPMDFALHVKETIFKELGLPVSIGVACSKRIAKLATNDTKPDGVLYIKQEDILSYVQNKSIREFPGIGKSYAKKLSQYAIETIGDALASKHLFESWGHHAKELYDAMQGIDHEKVNPDTKRKSIGMSRSFEAVKDREEIKRRILIFVRHLSYTVNKLEVHPASFYLKLRYGYNQISEARHTEHRIFSEKMLRNIVFNLYEKADTKKNMPIVFISISVSNFIEQNKKCVSLLDFEEDKKQNTLNESIQELRKKYGIDTIRSGKEI